MLGFSHPAPTRPVPWDKAERVVDRAARQRFRETLGEIAAERCR
jgi:hypothetical protein